MSSNSLTVLFSDFFAILAFGLLLVAFFGFDLSSKLTFIIAGSPPKPSMPDFPGETTSILTSSRFTLTKKLKNHENYAFLLGIKYLIYLSE